MEITNIIFGCLVTVFCIALGLWECYTKESLMRYVYLKYILILLIPIFGIFTACLYKKYTYIPQDNEIEEFLEDKIEHYTGIGVDFSPETKEE